MTLLEHLRSQVANVLDGNASPALRATHARTAAETAQDLRDAVRASQIVLSRGRVMDMLEGGRGEDLRRMAAELRDLADWPGMLPTHVLNDGQTGYGPTPLIREVAETWQQGALEGNSPIVPAFTTEGPYAGVDPVLPLAEDPDGWAIINVVAGEHRHWSVLTFETSKQVVDHIGPTGRALLDRIVFDEVDLAAETFIAEALIAGASGTRAAGADLGAALDEAEGAAGARGPVQLLIVNAVDLPAVRRSLAATYYDGPHPRVLVSAGQTAGTATVVGYGAIRLLASDYVRQDAPSPRGLAKVGAVARPFYLAIRDAAGIQTVTGIGA